MKFFTAIFLITISQIQFAQAKDNRPNIIVVMADDMGFSDLGCYGGEIKTPAIDKLASQGIKFSRFYNCGLCGPSRASLMTGCYPWLIGQPPGRSIFAKLKRNCVTLMQLMKSGGYQTCAVGRLDMVTSDNWHNPADVGKACDRVLGSASGGPGNYYREAKGTPWFKDGERWKRPEGKYSTDLISDFVKDFIRDSSKSQKPFFIYMSHYAPHWPLQIDEKYIAPYRDLYSKKDRKSFMQDRLKKLIEFGLMPESTNLIDSMVNAKPAADGYLEVERMAIHAAMIESIDRSVAALVKALKSSGQYDNTLILVLSDNGASHQMQNDRQVPKGVRPGSMDSFLNQGPGVAALNNTPLRWYKHSDYEGGIASPLIASWPANIKGTGKLSRRMTHISDIMPTCLELAGIKHPEVFEGRKVIPLTGKSFAKQLTDKETPYLERTLVFPKAINDGEWKLVLEKKSPELFNISKDRNEMNDLAKKYPEKVKALKEHHRELFKILKR